MSVNRVVLLGNLAQDPELRRTSSGKGVCNFTVATNEKWIKDGEKKEATEYHRCVAWGKDAEHISEWCTKGDKLYVEGKLQTRKWTGKDGTDRYSTEIMVRWWEMMSGTKSAGATSSAPRTERPAAASPEREEVQDDDLPF